MRLVYTWVCFNDAIILKMKKRSTKYRKAVIIYCIEMNCTEFVSLVFFLPQFFVALLNRSLESNVISWAGCRKWDEVERGRAAFVFGFVVIIRSATSPAGLFRPYFAAAADLIGGIVVLTLARNN